MKKIHFVVFFFIFLLSFIQSAYAQQSGVVVKPAVMYFSTVTEHNGRSGNTYQLIDIALGYINSSNIYFGAIYHTPTITDHGSTDTKINRTSYGASIGYASEGYAIFNYYFSAREDVSGTVYTGGTHYQIDLGYRFKVGSVDIAPQFSYFNYEFTIANGTTMNSSRKHTGIVPMVAIWIVF